MKVQPLQIWGYDLNFWQSLTCALMLVYAILILTTFTQYSITPDEHHHVRNGADIARWYSSFFQNRAVLDSKNTWLYGGTFDLLNHLVSTVLPLNRYDVAHLCNAFAGWLGVWAAYRIGVLLGGPRSGFIVAFALVLTPRYYGHAFNNPKDIPFAAGYLWSLYFLSKGLAASPNLPRKLIFKIGLAIGLTMGIRVGGVLLLGYLSLFYALRYLQLSKRTWQPALLVQLLGQATAITTIAYTTMICFWPWAQIHPLTGPWQAIQAFSHFSEYHHSFFNGQYVLNTQIPRTYTFQWLIRILPEFVFAGLAAWMIGLKQRSTANLQHLLLLFSGLFPIGYTVVSHTPLYDGIRHLLFVIPPLVILAAIGLEAFLKPRQRASRLSKR